MTKKPTQLDRIEKRLAGQKNFLSIDTEQVSHIEEALYGNGREGLVGRTARIEQALVEATANSVRNSVGITELLRSNSSLKDLTFELKASIEEHHKTAHLYVLVGKARFWVILFAAMIGFNLISRYIPGAITLLFQLFGVPNVHIPSE